MKYLRTVCPDVTAFHIPNGGYRTNVEAVIFQGLGVLPGVSDICLLWKPAKVAFIEMKAPGQKKSISAHQVAFLCKLEAMQIPNAVCDSLDAVIGKLKDWGVPSRAVQ